MSNLLLIKLSAKVKMATSVNDDENIASMQEANSGDQEEGKILQMVDKGFDVN